MRLPVGSVVVCDQAPPCKTVEDEVGTSACASKQLQSKFAMHLRDREVVNTHKTSENRNGCHGCDPFRLPALSWAVFGAGGAAA